MPPFHARSSVTVRIRNVPSTTPIGFISDLLGQGAGFSKVPKLYGPFSGVTIPFVSQERRGFKSSNFTAILDFGTLKSC